PRSAAYPIFLVRASNFDGDAFRVRFSGWSDQQRRNRLFDGVAEGRFDLVEPWAAVPGPQAAVFHFTRRLFTVLNLRLIRLSAERFCFVVACTSVRLRLT